MNGGDQKFCEVVLNVPFHDLDPMQMVWHGHYLKYFDRARSALFVESGIDLFAYFKKERFLFPVTKTSTKHIASLRYLDAFACRATLVEAHNKIVIDFQIRLIGDNRICVRGRSEQVAVKFPAMELMYAIPADIQKALQG